MDKKVKDTHIVIAVGLMVIYLLSNRHNTELTSRDWLLYAAAGVGFIGFTIPPLAKIIHKVWFWIGDKMGFVVSKLILGALFVVLVIPLSLVSRIFRKDLMLMKGNKPSSYLERDHVYSAEDFENPW